MVKWLSICLPVQGTRVQFLVQEHSTCCGANELMCYNTEPVLWSSAWQHETSGLWEDGPVPGSSPGGSREIRRVNGVGEESLLI